MKLAGMADNRVADHHLGAAAGMPRQVLRGPQHQFDTGGAADDAHRFERIPGLHRTAGTPRARRFPKAGHHHADVLWLVRQRRVEYGDLFVGGPAVVRNALDRTDFRGALDDLGQTAGHGSEEAVAGVEDLVGRVVGRRLLLRNRLSGDRRR